MEETMRTGKAWKTALAIWTLAMAVTGSAIAQVTTGSLTGNVRDAQGLGVPGATVVLVSETRDIRSAPVTTSADGTYSFPNIAPDVYAVEVTLPGFKTAK